MQYDTEEREFDLSGKASTGTIGTAASWLGWVLLLVLAIVTGVHAVSLVRAHTGLSTAGGDIFSIIRVAGVLLVELFAVVTAILLATHRLRAKQKPVAMSVEITWALFAAVNLVSSFAVEHGGELPQFVGMWVTYGLPVSALVMGIEFYIMLRLNPDSARADDDAELAEQFERVKHRAKLEVMNSPQMRAVIRQMTWQQLPPVIGRQMNLTDTQIRALTKQAPELLDLNGNGVGDILETVPDSPRRVTHEEMKERISANGTGPNPTKE